MKKIFNIVLSSVFLMAVAVMSTSCLILVDDEALEWDVEVITEEPARNVDPRITVTNNASKTGRDACYISEVYVSTTYNGNWESVWEADKHVDPVYADSNINFRLEPGRYYVCVRVIYPNMSKCYDYYDDVYSDVSFKFNYNSNYSLTFDGDEIFR